MRIRKELSIFNRYCLFQFQSMKIPKTPTRGVSARIPHTTNFVIFLDYDNIKDERLDDELLYLQELYKLGEFHILKTNEFGRHAICIDELPLNEALEVTYCSTCDHQFKRGIRINEYRTWILRGWEKGERGRPEYVRTLESPYNGHRLQSQAHAMFLKAFYGVNPRLVNPDGNTEIEIQGYNTSSKITAKDLKEEMKKHGLKTVSKRG
jgi:hypothetical protein